MRVNAANLNPCEGKQWVDTPFPVLRWKACGASYLVFSRASVEVSPRQPGS